MSYNPKKVYKIGGGNNLSMIMSSTSFELLIEAINKENMKIKYLSLFRRWNLCPTNKVMLS